MILLVVIPGLHPVEVNEGAITILKIRLGVKGVGINKYIVQCYKTRIGGCLTNVVVL